MRTTLIIAILLLSLNSIAQETYQISQIKLGEDNYKEAVGVMVLNGTKISINCNSVSSQVVVDATTYKEGASNNGEPMSTWSSYNIYKDEIANGYFTMIEYEYSTVFVVYYLDSDYTIAYCAEKL